MKSNLKISVLILAIIGLSYVSCNDTDIFIPVETPFSIKFLSNSIFTELDDLNVNVAEFSFDASQGKVYKFPDGTLVTFDPNSFVLPGGGQLPCFEVKAVIKMSKNRKDMVANTAGTNSGDKILESAGMFDTRVYCGNIELILAHNKTYTIQIPETPLTEKPLLDLFYGEEKDGRVNWIEADDNPNVQTNIVRSEWRDSLGKFVSGIVCFPEKLRWVNCDYFIKIENSTEPCLLFDFGSFNDEITFGVFCVFLTKNIVVAPCCPVGDNQICFNALPVGEKVHYVAIGKGKTGYYLGQSKKIIVKDEVVQIKIEQASLTQIKDFIGSL